MNETEEENEGGEKGGKENVNVTKAHENEKEHHDDTIAPEKKGIETAEKIQINESSKEEYDDNQ